MTLTILTDMTPAETAASLADSIIMRLDMARGYLSKGRVGMAKVALRDANKSISKLTDDQVSLIDADALRKITVGRRVVSNRVAFE